MTYPNRSSRMLFLTALAILTLTSTSLLAHNGGIILQLSGDTLVTGFDDESGGTQTIGDRAFSILLPPSLANDVPSFMSFANAPAGSDPIPGGAELYWDFLPMTHNGVTSNLLYWDGVGTMEEDVEFGALPQNDITAYLYTEGFTDNTQISGDPVMVPGYKLGTVATSGSNLRLHAHRWWFMESETSVPEGVYLMALQVRTPGYNATDPFFAIASTNSTSLDLALPWVDSAADSLVLDGDYNFDGAVGGSDFLAWQRQFGLQQQYPNGPFPVAGEYADGDGNGIVGAGDLSEWTQSFGPPAAPLAASIALVPEPTSLLIAIVGIGISVMPRSRRRHFA